MPLLTVMSPTTKLEVASLAVKVRARVASLDVSPSLTSAAVIASVGGVVSDEANEKLVIEYLTLLSFKTIAPVVVVKTLYHTPYGLDAVRVMARMLKSGRVLARLDVFCGSKVPTLTLNVKSDFVKFCPSTEILKDSTLGQSVKEQEGFSVLNTTAPVAVEPSLPVQIISYL